MKTVWTDYKNLRSALDTAKGFGPDCSVVLNSAEIRALLTERDALRQALNEYASPENWDQDEHGWSRLWLEPDSTSRRSYDGFELAFSALAQEYRHEYHDID